MAYYDPQAIDAPHKLTLDGREKLTMDGVKDVEGFDETMIVLETVRGTMVVRGEALHLQKLDLGGGQVAVDGRIDSLLYEDTQPRGGLLSRLFGA